MSFAMPLGMTLEEATKAMGYPAAETTEPAITPAVARAPRGRRKSEN
jgi:hypothetical protein